MRINIQAPEESKKKRGAFTDPVIGVLINNPDKIDMIIDNISNLAELKVFLKRFVKVTAFLLRREIKEI